MIESLKLNSNLDLESIVYRSENPQDIFCYSPGITQCGDKRIIVTLDLGGTGVLNLNVPKSSRANNTRFGTGKVYTSDDDGKTWVHRLDYPFWHARPFMAGKTAYVLGHAGDLMIMKSDDQGKNWSSPISLTENEKWHGAPCNVYYLDGYVYLAFDRRERLDVEGWNVSGLAPILLRAKIDSDLLDRANWTFSDPMVFRENIDIDKLNYFGIPFYKTPDKSAVELAPNRHCSPIGWLEPNVIQFKDPSHCFYSKNKIFHLLLRTHTGGVGYAALLKVIENDDGSMKTSFETVPSGKEFVYFPLPGGHLKFHILYDDISKLFWLISNQSFDSMTQVSKLPASRFNLPNNERNRLQLHFSKNCIDWCFAKILFCGNDDKFSRNYPSMIIKNNDIHYVCRTGDQDALDGQYTNLITFHTIKNFRNLVY